MKNPRLAALLKRAIEKTITSPEREELLALMADDENKADVEQALEHLWEEFEARDIILTSDREADILNRIFESSQLQTPGHGQLYRLVWPWLRIAALIVFVTVVGWCFYKWESAEPLPRELTLAEAAEQHNIKPGDNKAILTLGDGRIVVLDDINDGFVAEDAGASILKSEGGQLRYNKNGKPSAELTYNTIRIPRGGRYGLVLPDGSRVQLNADSYIRFPTQFTGDRREVELGGEAYFEIVHDKHRPFYVKTTNQVTKVLGTVFNISAYADETAIKTTLVTGSVEVNGSHGQQPVILKPGQAAINDEGHSRLTVIQADLDRDLAWQKGYFVFNNEHIKTIMQRISRWYDIEVEYQGNLEHKYFGGIFQQSKSIAQLLDSFKETGIIDFKIIERRVIVMEK